MAVLKRHISNQLSVAVEPKKLVLAVEVAECDGSGDHACGVGQDG